MNARDNTPLRTLIADRLAAGEDTAAGIAQAIGKGDTPSVVVRELNAMRTDGQVECEQRGKKKELVYWLAVPLAAQNAQPEVAKNTGSSASGSLSPSEGAAVQPKTAPVATASLSAAPVAADVQPQTAEIPPQIPPAIRPAEAEDDAMPPADASLLALANRELADRLARVAHVLRGSGLEGLKDLDDGADLQTAAAALTGAYQMALASLQARGEQFLEMQDELNKRDDELFVQAGTIVGLRDQLEALQREAMRGATCLSGQDRYTAAGYLVRASKRKPRMLLDKDKARDAALSSIRAGAQRAEVFALVPIGQARRGAEWRTA